MCAMGGLSREPLDLSSFSNFGSPDLWYQQLVFDGFQSGVPTNTTPTLTPTTLRTLEQSLISMNADDSPYHNEAGFVPPIVQSQNPAGSICLNVMNANAMQGGSTTVMPTGTMPTMSRPSVVASTINTSIDGVQPPISAATGTGTVRKNVGGRRPTKAQGITPEEEERRQLRRERNKAAAARCRKRRMDQTTSLEIETKGLEDKRQQLQREIHDLTQTKEELEQLLEAHKATGCRMSISNSSPGLNIHGGPVSPPDIKPIVSASSDLKSSLCLPVKQELLEPVPGLGHASYMTHQSAQYVPSAAKRVNFGGGSANNPPRPTSLPVAAAFTPASFRGPSNVSEVAGIPISTPSAGMFNFESLMEGGTGLTPVSGPLVPSCSSQQRNHNSVDMASPDANISNKLVSL